MSKATKEGFWARDLSPGLHLRSTFVTSDVAVRTDSRGTPYLSMKLVDKTGAVDARMWRLPRELLNGLPGGPRYVRVEGNTHDYRGMLQVKIDRLYLLDPNEVEETDYIPETELDRLTLAEEVLEAGRSFSDPNLRELFGRMADDEELWEAFCTAPAAKAMHHARLGGLLEHAVSCLKIAERLAQQYPVDRDLLIFGAVFHDVGKTRELSWESGGFAYTTEGRLVGHVVLGDRIVRRHIAGLPGFPEELALRVSHIMLAHQGEREYGSPEQPKTLEALLVNLIDNLDARAAMFVESTRNVSPGGWSTHENPLSRALYVAEDLLPEQTSNGDAPEDAPAL